MIEFKQGHNGSRHLDEKKLDKKEAGYFIEFLEEEIQRHKMAIRQADYLMRFFNSIPVLKLSYESSILGHMDDIKATNYTIEYLKNRWGI